MSKSMFIKTVTDNFEKLVHKGSDTFDALFSRDVHHVVITGLSRSGKSMFFTTFMSLLSQRSQLGFDNLPLLKSLPKDLIKTAEIRPIQGEQAFPLDENLARLQQGRWPESTQQVYGFELVITLLPSNALTQLINRTEEVIFRFYDYPGEWLTDLPMLQKDFTTWSDTAWSQQLNPPQKFYASEWHEFVEHYDFDLSPSTERLADYIEHYKAYLVKAKAAGITLLQPGSILLPNPSFDWHLNGFAPLPSRITSDPNHLWTNCFTKNYLKFQEEWLRPLQTAYFSKADKQIVLLDLQEGLSHSRAHLQQLKETLSSLASSFVYGADKWYKPKILFGHEITKVAFVATKVDLIPSSQHANILSLLQDMTAGVRTHLKEKEVEFQHFLISAIKTTDPGECTNCLKFTNVQGEYEELEFEQMPAYLKELEPNQNYPVIYSSVPKDVLPRMYRAQGIDKLVEYLICS
jgi:predicted YcjX-like family ATPase